MKKYFFVFVLFFSFQVSYSQQHTVCDNSLEFLFGFSQYGSAVQFGFLRYISDKTYLKANLMIGRELSKNLHHQTNTLSAVVGHTVFSKKEKWFFNAVGGIGLSNEKGRSAFSDVYTFHQNKGSFMLGGEVEMYINKKVSIVLFSTQHLATNLKRSWGSKRWYIMLGPRFHFYRFHRCQSSSSH